MVAPPPLRGRDPPPACPSRWCGTPRPPLSATHYVFVGALAAGADVVYLDAVQVEVIQPGETYSTTSTAIRLDSFPTRRRRRMAGMARRTPVRAIAARRRAGDGDATQLLQFLLLTAIIGLGLAVPQNVATDYARFDGAYPDYTRKPPPNHADRTDRGADRAAAAHRARRFGGGADRDASALDQMGCACATGARTRAVRSCRPWCSLDAKYQSGWRATTPTRIWRMCRSHLRSTRRISRRQPAGGWPGTVDSVAAQTLSRSSRRPASGPTSAPAPAGPSWRQPTGPTGPVYLGQVVQQHGRGGQPRMGLPKWNSSAWSAMGTGAAVGGAVYGLAVDASGTVYASAIFSLMGGVANTVRIAVERQRMVSVGHGGLTGGVGTIRAGTGGWRRRRDLRHRDLHNRWWRRSLAYRQSGTAAPGRPWAAAFLDGRLRLGLALTRAPERNHCRRWSVHNRWWRRCGQYRGVGRQHLVDRRGAPGA